MKARRPSTPSRQRYRSLAAVTTVTVATIVGGCVGPAAQASDTAADPAPARASLAVIDDFPRDPAPWSDFDWAQRARDFDSYLYDWTDRGVYTTIYDDPAPLNMPAGSKSYRVPAYYGDTRVLRAEGHQESVAQMASVVGATLVGIDKSNQGGRNYVDMLRTFFHPELGVARNTPDGSDDAPGSQSMWYATTANVLYSMLGAQYPDATDMDRIQRSIADKYYEMLQSLGGANADLTMQDFDFATMKPRRGRNEGGDVAAGTSAILLWAYERFGDPKYLDGATWAMDYLARAKSSLYYEMLPVLAPYVAARLNAEAGTDYDVVHMFSQIRLGLQGNVRPNWGIMGGGGWDGFDTQSLSGSRTDMQGYAFAMNSFATPWLAATAKYDTRFADAVGLWMLNLYNAGRFFYADQMSPALQQDGDRFINDPAHVIAYEGLRHRAPGRSSLVASADVYDRAGSWGLNPETTNLGIYGSSWVGWMGGTVHPTNVSKVLRTDLNALDMYSGSYPTSLYYNPGTSDAEVEVAVDGTRDLYDSARDAILASAATGTTRITVPAGSSIVLVQLPAGAPRTTSGHEVLVDGVGVRWDTDPQRDLALGASAQASVGDAAAVTDGDPGTFWSSSRADEQQVSVDLGETRRVSEVSAQWRNRPTGDVRVDTSMDGQSWTPLGEASAPVDGAFTGTARDARYVRLSVDGGGLGQQQLVALEVRQRDLALGAPATASSTANALNVPAHLTDGSDFTRWESTASDPQWVQLDLGRVSAVGSVRLNWETAAGKAYRVELSDDGSTWAAAAQVDNGDGGIDEVTLAAGSTGRYLRIVGTARLTTWAYSLYSVEAYAPAAVPATSQPAPAISLDAARIGAGGSVTVTGTGFDAGERVLLELHSDPVALGDATTGPDGTFTRTVVIPAGTAAQAHEIVARGESSGRAARADLAVYEQGGSNGGNPSDGGNGNVNGNGNGSGSGSGSGSVQASPSPSAAGEAQTLASTGGAGVAGGLAVSALALILGALFFAARRSRMRTED